MRKGHFVGKICLHNLKKGKNRIKLHAESNICVPNYTNLLAIMSFEADMECDKINEVKNEDKE